MFIGDINISIVGGYKTMVVIFDSNLRFRSQVLNVAHKAYIALKNLNKHKELRKLLCETVVL